MEFCLIGEKLSHSYSKFIHVKSGENYSLKELNRHEIQDFIKSKKFDGINVTIPYKKEIVKYLDGLSYEAEKTGAVNTVVYDGNRAIGYNTDVFGMEQGLKFADINLKDKVVMILGSGGTHDTAKSVCEKAGAREVITVSRTGDINYENCYTKKDVQIIINATPVGMKGYEDKRLVDISRLSRLEGVFDCVYNPLKTRLLQDAKKLGKKCDNGLYMLVCQALKSEELWTNKPFNKSVADKIYGELKAEMQNIVLIGMPSVGKTTYGKMLAEKLKREFFDTDEIIEKKCGMPPKIIIETYGEEYFRDREIEVIKEIADNNGVIIATGGGSVERTENIENLKKNGYFIYLKRDLSLLTLNDRPISKREGIEKLFIKRSPIYESIADETREI